MLRLRVQRVAARNQFPQCFACPRVLVDGPAVTLADYSVPVIVRPGLQPHGRRLTQEQPVGLGRGDEAAADGDHERLLEREQVHERFAFEAPVVLLAMLSDEEWARRRDEWLPNAADKAFLMSIMEGVASARDIDKALKLGLNHPMGPFELVDLVGLDTRLSILEYLHKSMGEKYRPCPLLVQYVKAGRLGKKVGRGVYEY